ncbi:MAG: serine/threonine protein kinase, partial [Coriobacteriia bacterium]|nr:serine/threonine protein kinase [Coriobacteriia bacterium]
MDQELLLNRYRLQQRRGRGGFGAVDIAWDQRLRRRVAIKRIPLRVEADDLPGIEEARTAALLSDAHIVSVYDFELTGTEALIIMENVDGPTLAELMQASQDLLDLDTISSILGSIVAALECAHENQVLHLDIKPANVLIDHAGRVKMSDFGLAALSSTMGFAEPQGGTIGYMPPEQIAMEDVDERSDLWALASLTYQLLTGENPFFAHTTQDSLDLIVNEPILLPSALRPELDESLDEILVYALDADKDSRPPSVGAFWKKLSPFLGQQKAGRQRLKALVEQWDAYGKVMVFDPKGARSSLLKAADSESEDREGKILRFGSGPGILWPTRTTKPLPWTLNPEPDFPRAYRNTDYGSTNYSETSYGDANYGEAGYREAGYDNDAVDDNYDSEPYDEEEAEPVPLWYRLSPRLRGVSARLLAALGCASMCWLGASGFEVFISALELSLTIRVVLTLVIALCGFFAPSLGVALASIVLGVGIIIAGQPVAGALVLVGLIVWWILCGRRSPLDATIMALTPLAAALGVPFVIALLAGYFLKLKRA